jgi:hypothetical protein
MFKYAKDLKKGEEIKMHLGVLPYPTYHKIISLYEENEIMVVVVEMGKDPEKFEYPINRIVEVMD